MLLPMKRTVQTSLAHAPEILAGLGVSFLVLFFWNPFRVRELRETVSVSPATLDFGRIVPGNIGKIDVQLKNGGQDKVEFKFDFECRCTHAEPSEGILAVGETRKVSFSYRPQGSLSRESMESEIGLVSLRLRSNNTMDEQGLALKALVIKPFQFEANKAKVNASFFESTLFELPLSLKDDVSDISIVSKPSFFRSLRVLRDDNGVDVSLIGEIGQMAGSAREQIFLTAALKSPKNELLETAIPVHVELADPFILSESKVLLRQGETVAVVAKPGADCVSVELAAAQCDIASVESIVSDNRVTVYLKESLESKIGHLRLTLHCFGANGKTQVLTKNIVVHCVASDGLEAKRQGIDTDNL
jgi:hypothetical protein